MSETLPVGTRVRVLPVGSHGKLNAGRKGTVVDRDEAGTAAIEAPGYREAFPIAARLDGRGLVAFVWRPEELEVIE